MSWRAAKRWAAPVLAHMSAKRSLAEGGSKAFEISRLAARIPK